MLESCFSGSNAESSQNVKKFTSPKTLGVKQGEIHFSGVFCLKLAENKLPTMAQTSISARLVQNTRTVGAFMSLYSLFCNWEGAVYWNTSWRRAWSCVLPVPKPTRRFGTQFGEPRWSLFPLCSWNYRISQKITCKISSWGSVEQHSHLQVTHSSCRFGTGFILPKSFIGKEGVEGMNEFWKGSSSEIFRMIMGNNNF